MLNFFSKFKVSDGSIEKDKLLIGNQVPFFRKKDQNNQAVVLGEEGTNYKLLIFAQEHCIYCKEIISKCSKLKELYNLKIIVVSSEPFPLNLMNDDLQFISSRDIFDNYFVTNTPETFLVDEDNYLVLNPKIHHYHGLSLILENYFISKYNMVKQM